MKKKVVRLTETDLRRIVKRVIKENEDDYKDRSMYDPYYGDDEEYDEEVDYGEDELEDKDMSAYELDGLIFEAMELLESEYGISSDYLEELNEFELIDLLEEHNETELAGDIQYYVEKLYADPDEPYDSIGGLSPNDLKRAFDVELEKMRKGK